MYKDLDDIKKFSKVYQRGFDAGERSALKTAKSMLDEEYNLGFNDGYEKAKSQFAKDCDKGYNEGYEKGKADLQQEMVATYLKMLSILGVVKEN